MDRKSILILVAAIAVLFMLSGVINHYFPPIQQPIPVAASATNQTTPAPAAETPAGTTNISTAGPSQPASTNATAVVRATPAQPETTLTVSNTDLIFHFTSRGGGLKAIAIRNTNYPAVVNSLRGPTDESNFATFNATADLPILATMGEQNDDYTLSQPSKTIVRAERTFPNGERIVKEFAVGDSGTNYLFTAKIRTENTSSAALALPARQIVAGTATAIGPLDDPSTLGTLWYNGDKAADIGPAAFSKGITGCIEGKPDPTNFEGGASNVIWVAMHSQYFAVAVIPSEPVNGVVVTPVLLPPPNPEGVRPGQRLTLTNNYKGYQTLLSYPAVTINAHQTNEQSFTLYAGPKEYNGLAKIGLFMGNNLDQVMGFTGWMGIGFFGFFSKFLLLCMNFMHGLGLTYGLSIIAITVIIKLVFWPMTAATARSQKRQQAIAPQLKAIADKYKDDPLKKHQKTTELLKEHKISPLGSCLPALITIPVFFGFYYMLRNAIELRGVSFLWAPDLTLPDTVMVIGGFPINLLPLIMGGSQLWMSHMTPPTPGMDPGQQKMMRWMPVIFIFIFYRMSAGLNLYYTVSNLLTIFQTKITKMGNDPAAAAPTRPAYSPPQKKK